MSVSSEDDQLSFNDGDEEIPSFWGVTIPSNSSAEVELQFGESLEISNAALSGGKGETVLSVTINEEKFVLATLSGNHPQYRLELAFGSTEENVKFSTTGPGSISLVGIKRSLLDNFDEEELSEETLAKLKAASTSLGTSDDDEEDEKVDEKVATPVESPAAKKKKNKKAKKAKANGEASPATQPKAQEGKGPQQPKAQEGKGAQPKAQEGKGPQQPKAKQQNKEKTQEEKTPEEKPQNGNKQTPKKGADTPKQTPTPNPKRPNTPGNENAANKKQKTTAQ